jgi:hypothetical protein
VAADFRPVSMIVCVGVVAGMLNVLSQILPHNLKTSNAWLIALCVRSGCGRERGYQVGTPPAKRQLEPL